MSQCREKRQENGKWKCLYNHQSPSSSPSFHQLSVVKCGVWWWVKVDHNRTQWNTMEHNGSCLVVSISSGVLLALVAWSPGWVVPERVERRNRNRTGKWKGVGRRGRSTQTRDLDTGHTARDNATPATHQPRSSQHYQLSATPNKEVVTLL